jgi:hypothetical protein
MLRERCNQIGMIMHAIERAERLLQNEGMIGMPWQT